jgi:tRNA G37 N-methylase Trm5
MMFSDRSSLTAAYARHEQWQQYGIGFAHVKEAAQRIAPHSRCLLLNFARVKNYAPKLIHAVSDVLVLLQSSSSQPPPT